MFNGKSSAIWKHVLLAAYATGVLVSLVHHEPWRDEAQAWLIARDIPLGSLFQHINFEGTPALWHLLLMPFAKLGAPYISLHVLHAIIAISIAGLVLYRSPFPPGIQIPLVFSYFLFWEYAVIARNYSISILLLWLIALLYNHKRLRPLWYAILIFFLYNTNVHSIFVAAALHLLYIYELIETGSTTRSKIAAVGVMTLGAVIALGQLTPSPDNYNQGLFYLFSWRAPFIALASAFFPEIPRTAFVTILLGLGITLNFILVFFLTSRRLLFILLFSYGGLFYVFLFKHTGSTRHFGFLLFILLFVLWIAYNQPGFRTRLQQAKWPKRLYRWGTASLSMCLVISMLVAIRTHIWEYTLPFSGAKDAATFLTEKGLDRYTLVAHPSVKGCALAPYLEKTAFWYPDIQDYGSYITWNTRYLEHRDISIHEALQRASAVLGSEESFLVLLDEPMPPILENEYTLLYQTPSEVFGYGEEYYFIYLKESDT